MRPSSCLFSVLICLFLTAPLLAQKEKREPLTEAEIEQIREAGIYPNDRVDLYTKFLNQHADTIKGLTNRSKSTARARRLDDELQDFTALMDELGSNLDTYSDRHADIRKALKPLNEATPRWLGILNALAGEPGFDLARKEAIESGEDLADEAKRLLTEQTEYFDIHKDERNQDRAEPKSKSDGK
ncbi:MAG: hypothetical protein ABSD67_10565 [Terracidiphilus sp.]|jgi:hypothetical protein